jgi:hypothetical protein
LGCIILARRHGFDGIGRDAVVCRIAIQYTNWLPVCSLLRHGLSLSARLPSLRLFQGFRNPVAAMRRISGQVAIWPRDFVRPHNHQASGGHRPGAKKISAKRPLKVVSRTQQFSDAPRIRPRPRAWSFGIQL